MELLATRARVTGIRPRYQYRLYASFAALSPERVFQIHYHSDFGHGRGLLARMSEVIAPIAWLAMPPGREKSLQAKAIHLMAARIETAVLSTVFPEAMVDPIPLLLEITDELPDERVSVEIADIMGRYQRLADDPALADRLDPRRL
jgi:hypothetical protein